MRIGIFDPYLDDLGGGEKYMMTIAQNLSKNNDVSVFWDNPEDLKELLRRFSLDVSSVKIVPNIFSPKTSTLQRFLNSRKYDLIILLSDGSIPLVSSRLVVHIQQPLKMMEVDSIVDKIKLKRVELFFSNSEYTKTFINQKFRIKSIVLYPPVKIQKKEVRKENIILHVGRFRVKNVKNDDYKKQGVMIEEFKKMVKGGLEKWKFVLAVSVLEKDLSDFQLIKKSADDYPIEFLINKSNDELWQIYSKAKIYWHASGYGEDLTKSPEFAEHFGISTVEAMGAAVVPVVINAGGQTEIVTNGKDGFLWNSLNELSKKTLKLINDEDILISLAKQAEKRALDFSEEKFNKKLSEIIQ